MTYYTTWQNRIVPRAKRRAFQRVSRHRTYAVALDEAKKISLRVPLPVEIHLGDERSGDTLVSVIDDGRVLRFEEDEDES